MEQLAILFSIILINFVLSGDNAVVIAMASRRLPPARQRAAIFIGSAGAIILRLVLTAVIVLVLKIPFLQAAGGILLVYLAMKLLKPEDSEDCTKSAGSLAEAIKIIIVADLIMSLDNTLAIAAVSKGNWTLLIIGLATSIPIIIFCSSIILYFMKKFPVILYIGAGILGWTGGEMLVEDKKLGHLLQTHLTGSGLDGIITIAAPALITLAVIMRGLTANYAKR
ncbi:integral membrane protein [Desulfocucumis palustris]|uniref:Integral membrane protein n=1 Tax=Desulfocucumis palustris TaxID=1898651 RepID=A0A2L2XA36_9FIRM|nr:TerC family protein [Desulfocucumis palustris]GBF32930.1 integral membrane protein [Desulfocucumis palustris]